MGGMTDMGGAATPQAAGANPALAQAFMSNQPSNPAPQGATVPQIMQPQAALPDIAAMIAQQRQASAQAIPQPAAAAPRGATKLREMLQRGNGSAGGRGGY